MVDLDPLLPVDFGPFCSASFIFKRILKGQSGLPTPFCYLPLLTAAHSGDNIIAFQFHPWVPQFHNALKEQLGPDGLPEAVPSWDPRQPFAHLGFLCITRLLAQQT